MDPDRTLEITLCKKCGSGHFNLDYFYRAKAEGAFKFLWELQGFFVKPRCGSCGHTTKMRFYDSVEEAIIAWNEGF